MNLAPYEASILHAILDNPQISVIVTGPDGKILTFNAGAEQMFQYKAEEMIGKCTPEVIHDREEVHARAEQLAAEFGVKVQTGFYTFVAKAAITGHMEVSEWTYIRKDKSRFRAVLGVSILRDQNGAMQGYIGISMPIPDKK